MDVVSISPLCTCFSIRKSPREMGAGGAEPCSECPYRDGVDVSQQHVLYQTGDQDAPEVIKDRNGEVVLGLCRRCGRGERELDQPCDTRDDKQMANLDPRPYYSMIQKVLAARQADGPTRRLDLSTAELKELRDILFEDADDSREIERLRMAMKRAADMLPPNAACGVLRAALNNQPGEN